MGNPERRPLHDFTAWRGELASVVEPGAFRKAGRTLRIPPVEALRAG